MLKISPLFNNNLMLLKLLLVKLQFDSRGKLNNFYYFYYYFYKSFVKILKKISYDKKICSIFIFSKYMNKNRSNYSNKGIGLNSYLTNDNIQDLVDKIQPDWVYDWGYKGFIEKNIPTNVEYVPQLWGKSAYNVNELDTYLHP